MIRRVLAASTVVLFTLAALPKQAEAQSVYILGGAALPTGDYGDIVDTGWLLGGGATFAIGEAGLWVGGDLLYARNGASDFDEHASPFSLMGIVGYDIPTQGKISPYVFGGAGWEQVSFSGGADSESGFGWQLGAGIGIETSGNISPFFEGRYQSASINDATLSFIGVEAGISIGLGHDDDM